MLTIRSRNIISSYKLEKRSYKTGPTSKEITIKGK